MKKYKAKIKKDILSYTIISIIFIILFAFVVISSYFVEKWEEENLQRNIYIQTC